MSIFPISDLHKQFVQVLASETVIQVLNVFASDRNESILIASHVDKPRILLIVEMNLFYGTCGAHKFRKGFHSLDGLSSIRQHNDPSNNQNTDR